jgi:hypothetical protein
VAGVRIRLDQKVFTIVSKGAGSSNRLATLAVLVLIAIVIGGCEALGIVDAASLLVPTFKRSEIFGFVAGLGTTFAAVPDLIRMLKRRSSHGMNPTMINLLTVGAYLRFTRNAT